ncbi:hypothetical protein HH214_13085 [Mucilaginibacter robiniae]|uniref:Tetratricopeptide repeat protein n=1 Tax=Mucilaginibacter robiniae TaxID=2728022 RepID=A0A7L5E2S8_9SPHI|nr:hypothetical protein [Mucilaginibacter robiniae]QJD96737.1 hypothetical protein HH214_13085 [Mucilaginibacter robiniae]
MQNPAALLRQLLINPTDHSSKRIDDLQLLINGFPQSGLLRALLATTGNEQHIKAAAVWYGGSSLDRVISSPGSLRAVTDSRVIKLDRKPVSAPKPEPVIAEPAAIEEPIASATVELPVIPPAEAPDHYYEVVEAEEVTLVPPVPAEPKTAVPVAEPETSKPEPVEQMLPKLPAEKLEETQKLIIENIASSNYFVFDQAFTERNPNMVPSEEAQDKQPKNDQAVEIKPQPHAEEGKVTPYNDAGMPYSFLWWLDKTRREHAGVYQPYTAPQQSAPQPNQPVPGGQVSIAVKEVLQQREREEAIIDRFIQEEPQIKPPSSDKLDNENKARRSSEDQDELITETLARIYIDQTLYSKAIAAYKILMLKNPEKSRYFASQIEMLSKKI